MVKFCVSSVGKTKDQNEILYLFYFAIKSRLDFGWNRNLLIRRFSKNISQNINLQFLLSKTFLSTTWFRLIFNFYIMLILAFSGYLEKKNFTKTQIVLSYILHDNPILMIYLGIKALFLNFLINIFSAFLRNFEKPKNYLIKVFIKT